MTNQNPYTHLRTLLDKDTPGAISAKIYCVLVRKEPLENWADFVGDTPNYTTSVDALIPLWPKGWGWRVSSVSEKHFSCVGFDDGLVKLYSDHDTPALVMLDCLLKVLEFEWGE